MATQLDCLECYGTGRNKKGGPCKTCRGSGRIGKIAAVFGAALLVGRLLLALIVIGVVVAIAISVATSGGSAKRDPASTPTHTTTRSTGNLGWPTPTKP